MHVNKVHHVTTISRVAKELGVDEDWLHDVASEMDIEDGCIRVYGIGEDGVLAFTDFGIETLTDSSHSTETTQTSSNPGDSKPTPRRPRPDDYAMATIEHNYPPLSFFVVRL